MKAVLCPLCKRRGETEDPSVHLLVDPECPGCQGKGWVEVREDVTPMNPGKPPEGHRWGLEDGKLIAMPIPPPPPPPRPLTTKIPHKCG